MQKKSYIEIYRSSAWMAKLRSFPIFIDGEKIGKIMSDERLRFEIAPGNHSLRSGIDFIRSNQVFFDVKKGQRVSFTIGRKHIPFWRKLFIFSLSSIIVTVGAFWGAVGIGIGSGVGSFILIKTIANPHIFYTGCNEEEKQPVISQQTG